MKTSKGEGGMIHALPPIELQEEKSSRCCGCNCIRRIWSIRMIIITVLMLSVIFVAGTIWSLNFGLSLRSVDAVINVARNYELAILVQHVADRSAGSYISMAYNQLNWLYQQAGNDTRNYTDRMTLLTLFYQILKVSQLFGIGVQFTDGAVYHLARVNNQYYELFLQDGTIVSYTVDIPSFERLKPGSNYSVATYMVWYNEAIKRKERIYTQPYIVRGALSDYLALALAIPLLDSSGNVTAVLLGSLNLGGASNRLAQFDTEPNTRLIIADYEGNILASTGPNHESPVRLRSVPTIANSSDSVLQTGMLLLQKKCKGLQNVPWNTTVDIEFGDNYRVFARSVKGRYGATSVAAIIFKDRDITRSVYTKNSVCAAVCGTAILVLLVLTFVIGCSMTIPLNRLSTEMNKLANMEYKTQDNESGLRLYEIEEMTYSMEQMKLALRNFERLGVQSTYLSVLFVDMKDFTSITEQVTPIGLVDIMCDFFTAMSEVIHDHSGIVDKYIGDAIMALWNVPFPLEHHEIMIVRAALRMNQMLVELNKIWSKKKYPEIGIRVGINSTNCLIGNVGSLQRVSYTALGDGVNIAARCESLNKRYNTSIIVAEDTYEAVKDRYLCRWLSYVSLKGKSKPLHVYEVICDLELASEEQKDICNLHLLAQQSLLAKDFELTDETCSKLLSLNPQNKSILELKQRLPKMTSSETPIILTLTEK